MQTSQSSIKVVANKEWRSTSEWQSFSSWDVSLALMDSLGVGAFLLDSNAEVIKINRCAKSTLSSSRDLSITRDRKLNICESDQTREFVTILRSESSHRDGPLCGSITINTEQENSNYSVTLVLNVIELAVSQASQEIRYVVAVQDLEKQTVEFFHQFGANYELSKAELSVLQYTVAGYSNKRIAQFRNVSEQTVKSQLKSIYEKTHSASRGELFRLMWSRWMPVFDDRGFAFR